MQEIVANSNSIINLSFDSYGETFIKYLDVDEKTLKSYKAGINNFNEYLKNKNITRPTRNNVIEYRDYLRETYCGNTVNSYMTALRAMFKYLSIHKLYDNLTEDVKGAKYNNTPKKQIIPEEGITHIYSNLTDKREKALFSLLITTGLRGIEVSRARIEDISIHNGEIILWVQCKKHDEKDEYVKLSQQVLKDLYEYIGDRKCGPIFISESNNSKGQPMSTTSIRKTIKEVLNRFGFIGDSYSLHCTRRSSATAMYLSGVDIYSIQQILHHKSQNTTMRYINAITRNENKGEYIISDKLLGGIK